ncbi:hypothetical protein EDC61_1203 [Sulfuritortus calidifontis]|uniref:CopL family metal-binding regulatory protein n=1 Tax=Sulfuritortus calidifontis TaxID=1914471 RepID=A0A4R3JUA0_9PROT|nr:hypothetical protein [Sulfuritortus calidifontis]TCS69442.1 hypothetical protein EDC61_1203 [Sulfuritortus calidifontis]
MNLLSRLHRQAWARSLRLVLACILAIGPASHSLAMAAVAAQEAQAMPCHHVESADDSNKPSLTGCHCGNAVQCTCAMAPTLPALPMFTGSNEADDYTVVRISLNTHLPPAPEPPPPRL